MHSIPLRFKSAWLFVICCLFNSLPDTAEGSRLPFHPKNKNRAVTITGELKKWHPVTFSVEGPTVDQEDKVNPFSDYRLEITFTQGLQTLVVPGYFAADGNAAETSATSGNVWRAHFTPHEAGIWDYVISLVKGKDIAIDDAALIDQIFVDDLAGSIEIADTDKTGNDFRGKGILRYVNEAYLRFDNGEWYLKSGIDSPENILAFTDFDSTYTADGNDFVKDFEPHVQDWEPGDPTWKGDKGKGIIGVVNYLTSQGVNSAFILLNNIGQENDNDAEGNDDVWPFLTPKIFDRYDVSKTAQWDIVFQHMQEKGMMLHLALQEIDNDALLDEGDLGRYRKLYYREMIARFGYHNAITWNIGEELRLDRNTDEQRKSYIDHISSIDPYGHAVIAHTWPGDEQYEAIYGPLLGYETFDGASWQIHDGSDGTGGLKVYNTTKNWYNQAKASGRKWYMTIDECCGWQTGVQPWGFEYNLDDVRVDDLWGNLMAGGSGAEWFFGDRKPVQYDLSTEDFRPYQLMWDYTRYALEFFHRYLPFHEMEPQTGLTLDEDHLVLSKPGQIYAVYLRAGLTPDLNLEAFVGNYRIKWYNPRVGVGLRNGTVKTVSGAGFKNLGLPPEAPDEDWVVLVENVGFSNYALADFTVGQSSSDPFSYNFNAGSSQSFGGVITSYEWDFGDGNVGSGIAPLHTYAHPGTYHVRLSITDSQGNTDEATRQTIIIPVWDFSAFNGLMGEYYKNLTLTETPETRLDPRINLIWGNKVPIAKVARDSFSVRWQGRLLPDHTDTYILRIEADDGARLWIDDVLLIDNWENTGFIDTSVNIALQAYVFHKIKIEYRDNEGTAHIRLFWSSSSLPEQIIPEDYLYYDVLGTLPVELTMFDGVTSENRVLLTWETASETNNAGFDVEKSADGVAFEKIGFVRGNGTTTEKIAYRFEDEIGTGSESAAYYRLKQIDFDGAFAYSRTLFVELPAPGSVALHENYPDPFNPSTVIRYEVPRQSHVRLAVFDATGRQVAVLVDQEVAPGRYQTQFDAADLASGVYFYRLETAGKSITHSMLLTK